MSIKSVMLAVLAGEDHATADAANLALDVAAAQGAHLSIVVGAIKVPTVVYAGIADIAALVTSEDEARTKAAQALGEDIARKASANGIAASVAVISEMRDTLLTAYEHHARIFDLIVAPRGSSEDLIADGLLETLLLGAGRPILVAPPGYDKSRATGPAVIAWNGSTNAARALTAAMPLVDKAGSADIVCITGEGKPHRIPGADLAPMLAHHNIKVTLTDLVAKNRDAGKVLLDHATMARARFLVMGGYGHTRLREYVFGGVTRYVLTQATLPVLIMH